MNGKLWKMVATALVVAMLMGAMQIIMSTVKAQPPAPAMYLDPATEAFTTSTTSVGTLFNVTGWVNTTETYGFGWSAAFTFNASQLQVVKAWFSGSGGTESEWLQNSSVPTTGLAAEQPYWNNTEGTIGEPNGFGETAYPPYAATSNLGSLVIIEFNITQAPPTGGSLSSLIQWDPNFSYPFDTNGIGEPGISYGNCTYTFSSSVTTAQQVTFAQTGLDSSATGTIVTVNGTAKTYGQLPNSTSAKSGDKLIFSYQSTVPSSVSGKQFFNTGVNVTSPLTISASETVTGSYETQYQVSFAVSPSGAGTTSPSGTNVWENSGSLSISATPNSGFAFSSWAITGSITVTNPSSASTTATINGPGTITANYVAGATYIVNFTESGLPSSSLWNVTFNGSPGSSTSDTITFTGVNNGVYSYSVSNVNGFAPIPSSGSLTVNNTNLSLNITFTLHNVIVTNVTAPAWVYQDLRGISNCANISVTVDNVGNFSENVWVTLYYNITAKKSINAYPVHLIIGQNFTFTFVWNTASVPCRTYTLTAVATIPTGSNTLSDGNITVRLIGDVNGDGKVDLKDIVAIAKVLGSTPSSSKWNPAADVNCDGRVDMKDLALTARNFGAMTTY